MTDTQDTPANPIPPGWPDPLESPQAEAIRAGKLDDTEIRNLFDSMERELRLHRERAANLAQVTDAMVEALAEFLCSEFDEDFNPCHGYSWPEHKDDDGYRGGNSYVKLQPSDVQARAREGATRILTFLSQRSALTAAIGAGGQAVAWQYRVMFDEGSARQDEWCDWQHTSQYHFNSLNEQIGAGRKRVETRALYTHPAPSGQAVVKPLEWQKGTYTTTDDDGGPMEGVPFNLSAWRADKYVIIRQRGVDGLFILRGTGDGVGKIVATLDAAKALAQADYERRILSALAHPVQPGWRDMESAPKDGVRILVIGGRHLDPEIVPADGDWWRHFGGNAVPTHWMPLPAAPKGE